MLGAENSFKKILIQKNFSFLKGKRISSQAQGKGREFTNILRLQQD